MVSPSARFIARSRDQLSAVPDYDSREGCAVGQYDRCEDEAGLPHIVVPYGVDRCCEDKVSRLVELAKAGCTCAVGIHRIRSRKHRLGEAAIQACRYLTLDISRRVKGQ